jgi:hypothetical protein
MRGVNLSCIRKNLFGIIPKLGVPILEIGDHIFSGLFYPVIAETGMGKPPSMASEGGPIDILRELEEITQSEFYQESGTSVFLVLKVRPESFPNGSPMPVW